MINIYDLVEESLSIKKKADSLTANLAGKMTLFDIANISQLENKHSDIIAYLLRPTSRHHHPEYGVLFLNLLSGKCSSITSTSINRVVREKTTNENRRIDILIEAKNDIIILENKVFASDQEEQLLDYYEWAKLIFPQKNIAVIYLTLFGSLPSEISLPIVERDSLLSENRFSCISYQDDILNWLNNLIIKNDELELKSAIVQYSESIKSICDMQEDDIMHNEVFSAEIFSRYSSMNRKEIIEFLDSMNLLKDNFATLVFVNFIDDLYQSLKTIKKPVYTHWQKRFENRNDWLNDISTDYDGFGLELPFISENSIGIAIEFERVASNPIMTFGIMAHGNGNSNKAPYPILLKSVESWKGYRFDMSKYWWECNSDFTWVIDGLLRRGKKDDKWEDSEGKTLAEHISKWFIEYMGTLKNNLRGG